MKTLRQQEQTTMQQTMQQPTPPGPKFRPTPALLPAIVALHQEPPVHSMATVVATEVSGTLVQTWYTVNRWMRITSVRRRSAKERTATAEFPRLIRNPTEMNRRILFHRTTGTPAIGRKKAADIVLAVNTTLSTRKVTSYVRI